ncbi:MAG: outer membrane lipid asymmetry maintenance protein MlaD [Sedimenticola sp.]|nr:MAG: outer membrane lipid asymmetry maintenance protein MlaD [Sedimenticola sp.]
MQKKSVEIMVGAFMAAGFVALFFLAMQVSNLSTASSGDGYEIKARFDNIGSLKSRSPVTMAGVKIGRVKEVSFDQTTYEAVVTLTIDDQYNAIPDDSFAKIFTAGLLGEQYVGIDPGGSDRFLKQGDGISMTQSALVLEEIVGQFLFSKAEEGARGE